MKICAIMPTYNRAMDFREALWSVGAQTRQPDEIFIVGDKTDKPYWQFIVETAREFMKKFRVPRMVMHNMVIAGRDWGSTPRNYAIMHTRCELLANLDDDCRWFPEHLEKLEKALVKNKADVAWRGSVIIRGRDFDVVAMAPAIRKLAEVSAKNTNGDGFRAYYTIMGLYYLLALIEPDSKTFLLCCSERLKYVIS